MLDEKVSKDGITDAEKRTTLLPGKEECFSHEKRLTILDHQDTVHG